MLIEKINAVIQRLHQLARVLEFYGEMTSDCRSISAPRKHEHLRYQTLAGLCSKAATEIALASSVVLPFDEADATEDEITQYGQELARLINGLSLARFTVSHFDRWSMGKLKMRVALPCPKWVMHLGDVREVIDSIRELGGLSDPRVTLIVTGELCLTQLAVSKWPERTPNPQITGRSAEVAALFLCLE